MYRYIYLYASVCTYLCIYITSGCNFSLRLRHCINQTYQNPMDIDGSLSEINGKSIKTKWNSTENIRESNEYPWKMYQNPI